MSANFSEVISLISNVKPIGALVKSLIQRNPATPSLSLMRVRRANVHLIRWPLSRPKAAGAQLRQHHTERYQWWRPKIAIYRPGFLAKGIVLKHSILRLQGWRMRHRGRSLQFFVARLVNPVTLSFADSQPQNLIFTRKSGRKLKANLS